jgi:hypothetical protein
MLTHHSPAPQSMKSRPWWLRTRTPDALEMIVGPFARWSAIEVDGWNRLCRSISSSE